MASNKVCGIVVTYQPDLARLAKLLEACHPQVDGILVVDNASTSPAQSEVKAVCQGWASNFLALAENTGIAAAQNQGIASANSQHPDYFLMLDQDSIPAPNMVQCLLAAHKTLQAAGQRIAMVGPRYLDERQNNPPPFIRINGLRLVRGCCTRPDEIVPVDYLIASGGLISAATLADVGGMAEALFIDYVDIEWGLRAKQRGYRSFGVCNAAMQHSLGEQPRNFMGRAIPMHNPLRHYYHFRNAIWLYRQAWPPLGWKLVDGWRLILKYIYYSLYAQPRHAHLKMMTLGIWHGWRNRLGKYPSASGKPPSPTLKSTR